MEGNGSIMYVVFIIPARGGSKRLPRKNMLPVLGKPMIGWTIEAAMTSKHASKDGIYVTTEDAEIYRFVNEYDIKTHRRSDRLSEDHVWTQDVLKDSVQRIININIASESKPYRPDIVVRLQANSPQVETAKIDECIDKLIESDLWEVFTVDENGIEDGAIHVMRGQCVFQDALSVYKGVVITDYIDVHTQEDLENAEERIKERQEDKQP